MTKERALILQNIGMILIVTVMLMDRFVFTLQDGFLLVCAVISAVLLGTAIVVRRIFEAREEAGSRHRKDR